MGDILCSWCLRSVDCAYEGCACDECPGDLSSESLAVG